MRCYFLKGNRIESVELLKATTDAEMIKEAEALSTPEAPRALTVSKCGT